MVHTIVTNKLKYNNYKLSKSVKTFHNEKKGRETSDNNSTETENARAKSRKIGKNVHKTSVTLKLPKMKTRKPKT